MTLSTLSIAFWLTDFLNSINNTADFLTVISGFTVFGSSFGMFMIYMLEKEPEKMKGLPILRSVRNISIALFCVLMVVSSIVPNKRTMDRIVAFEAANYVAKTPEAQRIKDGILRKLNDYLEK